MLATINCVLACFMVIAMLLILRDAPPPLMTMILTTIPMTSAMVGPLLASARAKSKPTLIPHAVITPDDSKETPLE